MLGLIVKTAAPRDDESSAALPGFRRPGGSVDIFSSGAIRRPFVWVCWCHTLNVVARYGYVLMRT